MRVAIERVLLDATDDLATIVHSDPAHAVIAASRVAARIVTAVPSASPAGQQAGIAEALREVEANARNYARRYEEGSDGRNTFTMFADWIGNKATIAALTTAPAVGEPVAWRPIESAPRDGESILAICASAYSPVAGVTWWSDGWTHYSRPAEKWHGGVGRWFPTHWMPLPSAPGTAPTTTSEDDRLRMAVEALEAEINAPLIGPTHGAWDRGRIAGLKEALSALANAAKGGAK